MVARPCPGFFVASLIHVPVGFASVHLILNGLCGLVLGWAAFPAILLALLLQAVLFGFGGLSALGVNTFVMAAPAVLCGLLFRPLLKQAHHPMFAPAIGALTGGVSIALAGLLAALALYGSQRAFAPAASLLLGAHVPVMIAESIITAGAVAFLQRVRPEAAVPEPRSTVGALSMALLECVATPTPIQGIDPRARLLVAVPLILLLAAARDLTLLEHCRRDGPHARPPAAHTGCPAEEANPPANAFLGLLWLTVPLASSSWSRAFAAHLALTATLKTNAILLIVTSLISTIEVVALGHALGHLHLPRKLSICFVYRPLHGSIASGIRTTRAGDEGQGLPPAGGSKHLPRPRSTGGHGAGAQPGSRRSAPTSAL